MEVAHGLKPIEKRKTNYSFHRTFGSVTTFPDSYDCNAFPTEAPDQNADGYPEACTAYAQTFLCGNEDKTHYVPLFTYTKTHVIDGGSMGDPCSMYDSLKSTIVYGVQLPTETTDVQAYTHKRGQYYQIQQTPQMDWFDAIRSALYVNRGANRAVSIGSPWFPEWNAFGHGSVMPMPTTPYQQCNWHDWAVSGWETTNGVQYLIAHTWRGQAGDPVRFSREVINKVMSISGTGAFTLAQWDGTPLTVQYSILYTLQVLIGMMIRKLTGK